jgi:heme/copper-type cytochrome/quinol oxidase subunit 4
MNRNTTEDIASLLLYVAIVAAILGVVWFFSRNFEAVVILGIAFAFASLRLVHFLWRSRQQDSRGKDKENS